MDFQPRIMHKLELEIDGVKKWQQKREKKKRHAGGGVGGEETWNELEFNEAIQHVKSAEFQNSSKNRSKFERWKSK